VSEDRIELRGLRIVGRHGALPEEQARAQPFEVDLDVAVNLAPAGASDALDDTLDYAAVVDIAHRIVGGESHTLLERVAARIADEVLSDSRVVSVTVGVRKLRPPVPADLATAGVRIVRRRGEIT
jgi:7,8-dihydroneopterin aldolase/epimerase/oxygenase